jgi:hypothetical protein
VNLYHTDTNCSDTRCFSVSASPPTAAAPESTAQVEIFFPGANITPSNEADWFTQVTLALLGDTVKSAGRLLRRVVTGAIIEDESQLLAVESQSSNSVTVTVATEAVKAALETAVNSSLISVTVDGVQYTGTCTNPETSLSDVKNDESKGSSDAVSTPVMVGVAAAVLLVAVAMVIFSKSGKKFGMVPSTTPPGSTPSSRGTFTPSSIGSVATSPEEPQEDVLSAFEWDNDAIPVAPRGSWQEGDPRSSDCVATSPDEELGIRPSTEDPTEEDTLSAFEWDTE